MRNTPRSDDGARRAYWASQLDAAYAFMCRAMDYPVAECGEPVVGLQEAAGSAGVTVHFSTTKIPGSIRRMFYLREALIPSFIAVARAMNERGWILKVEDGYRTRHMQRVLSLAPYVLDVVLARVIWELGGSVPEQDFFFKRLMVLTATAPKTGTHMSASAIDISVHRAEDALEVDRGGPYIELSEKTPMLSPFLSAAAAANRAAITAVFARAGFVAYPYEFWHYSQGDAYDQMLAASGAPARYGAVDVDTTSGRVTPVAAPTRSLHTEDAFRAAMDQALQRLAR